MASAESTVRSPLDSVFRALPEGHDKALKQAFYNVAANIFAVFVCGAGVAVFYILEAFLRPLLWAVLCGTFLHPFKNRLTTWVQRWLKSLRDSGTPILLGTILLPFQVINRLSDIVGEFVAANFKVLLAGLLGLPALYLLYYFGPVQQILSLLLGFFWFLYEALGYFSAIWVWTLAVAYALLVVFLWSPESSGWLKALAVPVWLALLFHAASIAGPLRVPLLLFVVVVIIVGFVTEIRHANRTKDGESPGIMAVWRILSGTNTAAEEMNGHEESEAVETVAAQAEKEKQEDPSKPASRPSQLQDDSKSSKPTPAGPERTLSDLCFIALFWAILVTMVWKHIWVLSLLPFLFGVFLAKKLASHLGAWDIMQDYSKKFGQKMSEDPRFDLLAPKPVRGLGKLVMKGDKKIVLTVEQSMDSFMSILVVLLLLFGTIFVVIFSAVQVHKESMHLVTVSSNLVNNSLHRIPELEKYLPNGDDMQNTMDSMVGNAYVYGRQWIADKLINSVMDVEEDRKEQVEKQVLEVWDRLYTVYFARNTSKVVPALQRRNTMLDLSNMTNLWDIVQKDLNIVEFAKENIGTFMSVFESVWAVLMSNISLLVNLLTAFISLVTGSGTAILNFVLAFIIFITTLFYLLALSGATYKPVEWFGSMSPAGQGGSRFGKTVEEAISSVFVATFKMSAFYGLYTWLTHTIFGVQIVFIPSAIAAMCAGIPFLGTYWAAIPGVLELWLVSGEGLQAIMLLVAHFLPISVVDSAIYSQIKGGHPYMTGLAIAGGMYWLGLEGAIMGPIILCCLVVAVNVFGSMMKPDEGISGVSRHSLPLSKRK